MLLIKRAAPNADANVSEKSKMMERAKMLEAPVLLLPSKGDTKYTFEYEHVVQRNRSSSIEPMCQVLESQTLT